MGDDMLWGNPAFPTRCTRLDTQAPAQLATPKDGWLKQVPAFVASVQLPTEYSEIVPTAYHRPLLRYCILDFDVMNSPYLFIAFSPILY